MSLLVFVVVVVVVVFRRLCVRLVMYVHYTCYMRSDLRKGTILEDISKLSYWYGEYRRPQAINCHIPLVLRVWRHGDTAVR